MQVSTKNIQIISLAVIISISLGISIWSLVVAKNNNTNSFNEVITNLSNKISNLEKSNLDLEMQIKNVKNNKADPSEKIAELEDLIKIQKNESNERISKLEDLNKVYENEFKFLKNLYNNISVHYSENKLNALKMSSRLFVEFLKNIFRDSLELNYTEENKKCPYANKNLLPKIDYYINPKNIVLNKELVSYIKSGYKELNLEIPQRLLIDSNSYEFDLSESKKTNELLKILSESMRNKSLPCVMYVEILIEKLSMMIINLEYNMNIEIGNENNFLNFSKHFEIERGNEFKINDIYANKKINNFVNKTLKIEDLKKLQTTITSMTEFNEMNLDLKTIINKYYKKVIQNLNNINEIFDVEHTKVKDECEISLKLKDEVRNNCSFLNKYFGSSKLTLNEVKLKIETITKEDIKHGQILSNLIKNIKDECPNSI